MEETDQKPKAKKRKRLFLAMLVLMVLLVGGACFWFFAIRDTGPIPRKYTKGLDFTLYYPTRLPAGYVVNRNSFERKENSIIFSIEAPKGKNVAVSLQAIPPEIPTRTTNKALPISLPGERDFTTAVGSAHLGLWGKQYVSDILTPKGTWIILNVSGFTPEEATKVTQSFVEL